MNLIDAKLERGADGSGGPQVAFGGHRLEIPTQVTTARPGLERYLGQDIVLGVRPEHLSDATLLHDPDAAAVIQLPVRLREELGSEVHIHCGIGRVAHHAAEAQEVTSLATLVARMDRSTTLTEGQDARVHVEVSELHFFDSGTGLAIRD